MDQSEIRKLASDWIAYEKKHEPERGTTREERLDEVAFEIVLKLMELVDDDWINALAICAEIARQSNDPWILEILGAGPLEDLLERGHEVLQPFLAEAKANPSFRQALRHIWPRSDADLWRRFEAVRDKLELIR